MGEAVTRRSRWKLAIVAVIAIEVLGGLSGRLSNSGYGNRWFDGLRKPSFMPPGWAFGLVWPILYALLGIALAMIIAEPQSRRRKVALVPFVVQLTLNFAWSPVFFAAHDTALAKWIIVAMAMIAGIAAAQFYGLRKAAGLLLLPYLAWLIFALALNSRIEALNPGAGTSLLGWPDENWG